MTAYSHPLAAVEPLPVLRRLRTSHAWSLLAWAAVSVAAGAVVWGSTLEPSAFWSALGLQCVVWGLIDAAFAAAGVAQSVRTARVPISPQAEADEFLAAEKLLRVLKFNHGLNVAYVVVGGLLLSLAAWTAGAALAGHGAGVVLQGGFLLAFDLAYAGKYRRLMDAPIV